MGWETSTRRARLPRDWKAIAARVLARDRLCVCKGPAEWCRRHGDRPCGAPAVEVDHLERGDDHRMTNLGGKCSACHRAKTQHEANAAKPSEKRQPGKHPGLR